MKKLIALSILVSLFAVGVFAQDAEGAKAETPPIVITGSAEAALVPLQIVHSENDTYVGAGLGRPEDPQGPKVELNGRLNFLEGKIGAKVDLLFFAKGSETTPFAIGDNAELWFQPTDWFKLDAGHFVEDRLRGKVGKDNWYPWTTNSGQKDYIFSRFNADVGVLLGFTPSQVKGLYVGVMVPKFAQFDDSGSPFLTGNGSNLPSGDGWRAAQIYKGIQAAIGYDIEGTGLFRIQYVGSRNTDTNILGNAGTVPSAGGALKAWQSQTRNNYMPARIEAAFAYTGMEGLVVDFGLKFWLPTSEYVSDTYNAADKKYDANKLGGSLMLPIQISLGAEYTAIENVSIAGRIDTDFAGSFSPDTGDETSMGFWLAAHLWPSYNLGFAWVGLDFGLQFLGETKTGSVIQHKGGLDVGFGLWLKKEFGASSVKLGVAYKVGTEMNGADQPGVLSVPIVFDYSF